MFALLFTALSSAGELPCPGDMILLEGGGAWLGKWGQKYGKDQFPAMDVQVEPYCIDALPFPGRKGAHWPEDGLRADLVEEWRRLLGSFGRRFCTVEELVWATASGSKNLRFLTGNTPPTHCETHISWGDMHPLGAHTGCVNPWGIRDVNVASSWALASDDVELLRGESSRQREVVIVGGTNRRDTFYAPNNFGLHAHDPGDIAYFDDQLRVCANPGEGLEAEWQIFREAATHQGTFEGALLWFYKYGLSASPLDVLETPFVYVRDDG